MRRASSVPPAGSSAIVAASEITTTPLEWEPHAHDHHELVWVRGGTLTTRAGGRVFTVSTGYGLWLPAGTVHSGRLTIGVEFSDARFEPSRTPHVFAEPTTIVMTPLLEALLDHLARDDLDGAARARAERVVFDVIAPAEHELVLRVPGDARIDPVAQALLADPADQRSLEEWAAALDVSERTLARAFRRSTGLSFTRWRQVLRVHEALRLLADGHGVHETSRLLGYAQPSTFIAAFRRVLGTTPGLFHAAAPGATAHGDDVARAVRPSRARSGDTGREPVDGRAPGERTRPS
ncbi:AraC family transcriptional regulator [Pseudoclavibacter chungangensis]|uniref:HTH-type transcriptional regulator RipA n=1 Tax=Pseudoclavibacter chungangensis TaxID=587635 RepID=A0A7J5BQZ8_9MICO|nr:AraC family transcriptional regulator [Pseudoclavibacter chungangensis]